MTNKKTSFVTLTYDDEHLPFDKGLHKRDLQLFFKRLRKSGLTFHYFAVGEYGEKEQKYFCDDDKVLIEKGKIKPHGRPHYHVLFFGLDFENDDDFQCLVRSWFNCSSDYWTIHRKKLVGSCERESIQYVCDYMQKKQYGLNSTKEYWNIEAPFSLCSQKLGLSAFSKDVETYKQHGYILYNGKKVPIPRYFREKFEIPVSFDIPDNNIYKCMCLEKHLISKDDIPFYDKLSRKNHTNEYFHLIHDKYLNNFEEVQKVLIHRNNLFNRSKI